MAPLAAYKKVTFSIEKAQSVYMGPFHLWATCNLKVNLLTKVLLCIILGRMPVWECYVCQFVKKMLYKKKEWASILEDNFTV